jgi:hypothetical protein
MAKNSPNPFQKMVRGVLRDLGNQVNSKKADKSSKGKTKKSTTPKSQTKPEQEGKKRSRP